MASTASSADPFARLRAAGFRRVALRLSDGDLPRTGALIGFGEDELHALIEVESFGSGFDRLGRPKMLFEPHLFWRHLGPGTRRDRAAALGLAYATWRPGNYPADSYPRLAQALDIDAEAALTSASWGLTQILGENHAALGYATAADMVVAFCAGEAAHLAGTVALIQSKGLAGKLKAHDWPAVARGWNGPGYAANHYDDRLAAAFAKWNRIPDTHNSATPAPSLQKPARAMPVANPAPAEPGFWSRLHTLLSRKTQVARLPVHTPVAPPRSGTAFRAGGPTCSSRPPSCWRCSTRSAWSTSGRC